MSRVEWCQCEDATHEDSTVLCTCPRTAAGVRLAAQRCQAHNSHHHPYGVQDRSAAPRTTAFGVYHLCRHCRAAGHMEVKP